MMMKVCFTTFLLVITTSTLLIAPVSSSSSEVSYDYEDKWHSSIRKLFTDLNNNGIDDDIEERIVVRCTHGHEDSCLQQLTSTGHGSVGIIHQLKGTDFFAIKVKRSQIQELSQLSEIEGMELDAVREAFYAIRHTEDDIPEGKKKRRPRRNLGGDSENADGQITPYGIDLVKARQVWATYGITGKNIKVCVMDSGLEPHEDLNYNPNRIIDGWENDHNVPWNEDGDGHGTHVAGIIGATDNGIGVVGVAPDVDIFVTRVFNDNGSFYASDIESAAQACYDAGAHIINMSLGGNDESDSEKAIFQELHEKGLLSIASAGNSGEDPENPIKYPAAYDFVMSVGSLSATKVIATTSTYNEFVNIAAPGVQVESLHNDGISLIRHSGTSMACPNAAGVAALLKCYDPTLTPDEIINLMEDTVEDLGDDGHDNHYGHGLIDAMAAIAKLSGGPPPLDNTVTCIPLEVTVNTDRFAYETSWEVRRMDGSLAYVGASLVNENENVIQHCIPDSCYTFRMGDAWGDGIDGGSYEVKYDGVVVLSGSGDFDYHSPIKHIGSCDLSPGGGGGDIDDGSVPAVPTPPPASAPTPISLSHKRCVSVEFTMVADEYAVQEETQYKLIDLNDDSAPVWRESFLTDMETYTESSCLFLKGPGAGCYMLYAYDQYGDGVGNDIVTKGGQGSSKVTLAVGGLSVYRGGNFGSSLAIPLGNGCDRCIPLEFHLTADEWVEDESSGYSLQEMSSGNMIWDQSELVKSHVYDEEACLNPNKCYHLILSDNFNDGIGNPMTVTYGGVALEGMKRFISLGRGCTNP